MLHDYEKWLNCPSLPDEYRQILLTYSPEEIKQSFFDNLSFGTGGLRGLIGVGTNKINDLTIAHAALGLAMYLKEHYQNNITVAIAYDTRLYSKRFALMSARVMASNNIRVLLFDDARPTPQLSFAVAYFQANAGIVITASHNPKQYNGFKIYDENGCQFTPELAIQVSDLMYKYSDYLNYQYDSLESCLTNNLITYIDVNFDQIYLSFLHSLKLRKSNHKKLKIVYTPLYGVGYAFGATLLEQQGYQVIKTNIQDIPNHNFTNLLAPNPENEQSFDVALEVAKRHEAHLIMATDADGDRLGVAYLDNGQYLFLDGSQLGALMIDYLTKFKPFTNGNVVISTIVTPSLGMKIAKHHGLKTINTLTGFKFIGEQIAKLNNPNDFYFGYEESLGFLISPRVRDKDAFQAMVLLAEMFNYYLIKPITINDVLNNLYKKYGYYANQLVNIDLQGIDGLSKINAIMAFIRQDYQVIASLSETIAIEDYLKGTGYDNVQNIYKLDLPTSDVIKFRLINEGMIVFRPSGTEPKLKIYLSVVTNNKELSLSELKKIKKEIDQLLTPWIKN